MKVVIAWTPSAGIASIAVPATSESAPQITVSQKPRQVNVLAAAPSWVMPAARSEPATMKSTKVAAAHGVAIARMPRIVSAMPSQTSFDLR